jgi:hypothetical protein
MVGEHPLFFLAKRMESSASGEGRRFWQSSSLVDALRNQFAGPSEEMALIVTPIHPDHDRPVPAEDEHPRLGKLALSLTPKPKSFSFPPTGSEFYHPSPSH